MCTQIVAGFGEPDADPVPVPSGLPNPWPDSRFGVPVDHNMLQNPLIRQRFFAISVKTVVLLV